MSIFKEEILLKLGVNLTPERVDELEKVLREECRVNGIPYTTGYLKTIVTTIKRFVVLGSKAGEIVMYSGPQIMYAIAVERLLSKQEQKIAEVKKANENILP